MIFCRPGQFMALPESTYTCDRGHVFKVTGSPVSVNLGTGGGQVVSTGPLCPYCARQVGEKTLPGLFVVFEGADACGKTTQVRLLKERLEDEGREAVATSFPRYGSQVGEAISRHLRGEIALVENEETLDLVRHADEEALFHQALHTFDRYVMAPSIVTFLKTGRSVVSSRWWQSAVLYGADSGLDAAMLDSAHALLPRATLNVLLTLSEAETLRRRPDLRDHIERDRPKQARVRAAYEAMWAEEAKKDPGAWVSVKSDDLSDEQVHGLVWEALMDQVECLRRTS